eukprot:14085297-Ditylum_brightwellii.AAC.1
MNCGFGGTSATKMHSSKIHGVDGYLGPFVYPSRAKEQLKVGDTATLVFEEDNEGPFWISPAERTNHRYDQQTGKKSKPKDKTSAELRNEMLKMNDQADVRGNKKILQEKALTMGIDLKKVKDKIIEGWVGKPKGMKQVAFERGFIDLDNLDHYKKDVYKDDDEK